MRSPAAILDFTSFSSFFCLIETPVTETQVTLPNATTCYTIPTTMDCPLGGMLFIPGIPSLVRNCLCTIYPQGFNDCSCIRDGVINAMLQNGSICLSAPMNVTTVNFICRQNDCDEYNCYTYTILQSYRNVLAGM